MHYKFNNVTLYNIIVNNIILMYNNGFVNHIKNISKDISEWCLSDYINFIFNPSIISFYMLLPIWLIFIMTMVHMIFKILYYKISKKYKVLYYPKSTKYFLINMFFIYIYRSSFLIIYNFNNLKKFNDIMVILSLLKAFLRAIMFIFIIGIPYFYYKIIINILKNGIIKGWLELSPYINIKLIIRDGDITRNNNELETLKKMFKVWNLKSKISKKSNIDINKKFECIFDNEKIEFNINDFDKRFEETKESVNSVSGLMKTGDGIHGINLSLMTRLGATLTSKPMNHPKGFNSNKFGIVPEKFDQNIDLKKIIKPKDINNKEISSWEQSNSLADNIKCHDIVSKSRENDDIYLNEMNKKNKFVQSTSKLSKDDINNAKMLINQKGIKKFMIMNNKINSEIEKGNMLIDKIKNNLGNPDEVKALVNKEGNKEIYNKLLIIQESGRYSNNAEIKEMVEFLSYFIN